MTEFLCKMKFSMELTRTCSWQWPQPCSLHCNDQTSMNRAQRSVLNFKYSVHVSEVNELLDEHWANFVQREKPFQLQSMCNVINVYYVLIKGLQSRIPIYLVLPSLVDEGWYQLAAVLNFCVCNRPKKNWNSTQFILELWSRLNLYNPLVRQQSSSLSPSLSPCQSSGNHSWRLFQKTIEGFDCKINGQALWAALQHSLGGLDGRDQTQCVAKSSAVAADCVAATGSL